MKTRFGVLINRILAYLFSLVTNQQFKVPESSTKTISFSELENMNFKEFWDADIDVSDTDINLYLTKKTNNWDLMSLSLLFEDISSLAKELRFFIYDPDAEAYKSKQSIIHYQLETHDYIMKIKSYSPTSLDELLSRYITENKIDLGKDDIDVNDLELTIDLFENTYDCYVDQKQFNILTIITMKYEEMNQRQSHEKPQRTKKIEPLIFENLFHHQYQLKLKEFFAILLTNGFVDEKVRWVFKTDKNEPAKLFHYLDYKNVLKPNKFKPAISCFYAKFDCEIVEKDNGNPRATTRKNAKEANNSFDEKQFDKILLNWINKK